MPCFFRRCVLLLSTEATIFFLKFHLCARFASVETTSRMITSFQPDSIRAEHEQNCIFFFVRLMIHDSWFSVVLRYLKMDKRFFIFRLFCSTLSFGRVRSMLFGQWKLCQCSRFRVNWIRVCRESINTTKKVKTKWYRNKNHFLSSLAATRCRTHFHCYFSCSSLFCKWTREEETTRACNFSSPRQHHCQCWWWKRMTLFVSFCIHFLFSIFTETTQ